MNTAPQESGDNHAHHHNHAGAHADGSINGHVWRAPQLPRRAPAPRTRSRRMTIIGLLALLVLVVVFGAITTLRPGSPSDTHAFEASRAIPPGDLEWRSDPIDQPAPVPGHRWRGWATHPNGHCAWMPAGLLDPLRPTAPPRPEGSACAVDLADDHLEIKWDTPDSHVVWDPASEMTPGAIAGLDAFVLPRWLINPDRPQACEVSVATRSTTGLTVLAWSTTQPGRRCTTAKTAAELIARRMIPAAGGTLWPHTPQHPDPATLTDHATCELLEAATLGLDGYQDPPTLQVNAFGETCTTTNSTTTGDVETGILITVGPHQGLAQTPTLNPHQTTARTLGRLPARQEYGSTGCTISVEPSPGRLLRISRHTDRNHPIDPTDLGNLLNNRLDALSCDIVELTAARAVQALLDATV